MSTQLKLIKRTPDLSTNAFSSFLAMYKSYIEELSAFSQRLRDEPVSIMEVCDIWNNPDVELYFVMHDDEPAGFIVLGINANKHESSDWFIGEFYIKKNLYFSGGTYGFKINVFFYYKCCYQSCLTGYCCAKGIAK